MKEESCVLKLKNLYFEKSLMEIKFIDGTIKKPLASYMPKFNIDNDGNIEVKLATRITDRDKSFLLETIVVGEFSLDENQDIDSELAANIIKQNTLAILYPYIRSQVTLMTAIPNFQPIVLKPINIVAMLEDLKARENK